jgi:hypothetical protein
MRMGAARRAPASASARPRAAGRRPRRSPSGRRPMTAARSRRWPPPPPALAAARGPALAPGVACRAPQAPGRSRGRCPGRPRAPPRRAAAPSTTPLAAGRAVWWAPWRRGASAARRGGCAPATAAGPQHWQCKARECRLNWRPAVPHALQISDGRAKEHGQAPAKLQQAVERFPRSGRACTRTARSGPQAASRAQSVHL